MTGSKLIRVLCLALGLALLPLQAAKACSCGPLDPRDALASSEGAFVGTFIESHLAEPPDPDGGFSSGADTIYSFRLDEEYKGELGEPGDVVEVHSPYSGASCGLEVREGDQYGLFLNVRERDGVWTSGLCSQVSPKTMRTAASPLPAPTGEGPVKMLVGGSFGKAQVMSLDRRGRTLGYGFGNRDALYLDVCPGSKRSVEIAQTYPEPSLLITRDLATLRVVRKVELPFGRGQDYPRQNPSGLDCRTSSARRIVVFSRSYSEPEAKSLLLKYVGRRSSVLHQGSGTSATFGERHAYLTSGTWGRDLVKVSLGKGAERDVARLPARYQGSPSLSPNGTRLAGLALPPWDEMESQDAVFYTVNLETRRVRTRSLGVGEFYGHTGWLNNRRPVLFAEHPGPSRVFDLRLRRVSRFGRWPGHKPVILGRTAFAPGWDTHEASALYKVRLPGGSVQRVRGLPSPMAFTIVEAP